MLVVVVLQLVIGLAFAVALRRLTVLWPVTRVIVLVPFALLAVVSAVVWRDAVTTGFAVEWFRLGEVGPFGELVGVTVGELWRGTGITALILLAGLLRVPSSLLAAAVADGATAWQRSRRVVLPAMGPAIAVAATYRALDTFRILEGPLLVDEPGAAIRTAPLLVWDTTFSSLELGLGAAMSMVLLAIMLRDGGDHGAAVPREEGRVTPSVRSRLWASGIAFVLGFAVANYGIIRVSRPDLWIWIGLAVVLIGTSAAGILFADTRRPLSIWSLIGIELFAAFTLVPLLWTFTVATAPQGTTPRTVWPQEITWDAFDGALHSQILQDAALTSVFVAGIATPSRCRWRSPPRTLWCGCRSAAGVWSTAWSPRRCCCRCWRWAARSPTRSSRSTATAPACRSSRPRC